MRWSPSLFALMLLLASSGVTAAGARVAQAVEPDIARFLVLPEHGTVHEIVQSVDHAGLEAEEVSAVCEAIWSAYEANGRYPSLDRTRLPATLANARSADWEVQSRQTLAWTRDGWRLQQRFVSESGALVVQHVVSDAAELRRWTVRDGRASPMSVEAPGSLCDTARGFLLEHARFQAVLGVLASELRARGAIQPESDGPTTRWWLPVDVTRSPWREIRTSTPVGDVGGLAESIALTVTTRAIGEVVGIEWYGPGEELLDRQRQTWAAGGRFPSAMQLERFLPGLPGRRLVDARYSVAQRPGAPVDLADGAMAPPDGSAVVLDQRFFDETVTYRVDADHPAPTAHEIMERARVQRALRAEELAAPAPRPGRVSTPERGIRVGPVEAWPAVLDLGPQSLGARLPIRFELRNVGGDLLTLGRPESSCDCLDLAFQARRLLAGAAVELSGIQHVQDVGEQERTLRVPILVDAGAAHELELRVRFHGLPGFVAEPAALRLDETSSGRAHGGWPVTLDLGSFGAMANGQLEARVSGDFGGELSVQQVGGAQWVVTGEVHALDPALYGHLLGSIEIATSEASGLAPARIPVSASRRPLDGVDLPPCSVPLTGGAAVEMSFPGLAWTGGPESVTGLPACVRIERGHASGDALETEARLIWRHDAGCEHGDASEASVRLPFRAGDLRGALQVVLVLG